MDTAISEFLLFFGLDASQIPAPIMAVIGILIMVIVMSVFCDIWHYLFRSNF